jgi:hypothetical protein
MILIPNQTVFPLRPECYVFSEEAAHTNCIVICLTLPNYYCKLQFRSCQNQTLNHFFLDQMYVGHGVMLVI